MVNKIKTGTGKTNKSGTVREFVRVNPTMGPTEVVEYMRKQGLSVSMQLVSNIRSKLKKEEVAGGTTNGNGNGKRATKQQAMPVADMSSSQLLTLKKFVQEFGGTSRVTTGLQMLTELTS